MYDSHTHLNNSHLSGDIPRLLNRFQEAGGKGLLNVGYCFDTIESVINTAKEYDNYPTLEIKSSIGLHPELFYSNSDFDRPITSLGAVNSAIKTLENLLKSNLELIDAIGEIGLDYYRLSKDQSLTLENKAEEKEVQKYAFRKQLELALQHHLPITIHTRDIRDSVEVFEDVVKLVAEVGKGSLKGSFHSYTGPMSLINQITALGFNVGFNGILTYASGENVRDNLLATPLQNILLETDAPYLPPREKRKKIRKGGYKYCEPADAAEVLEKASEVLGISKDEISRITSENYQKMFSNS